MNIPFNPEKIAIGEGIYSRPQNRINNAYCIWKDDNPSGTPQDFLQRNCKRTGTEGTQIVKWQCEDDNGQYIVKMAEWAK